MIPVGQHLVEYVLLLLQLLLRNIQVRFCNLQVLPHHREEVLHGLERLGASRVESRHLLVDRLQLLARHKAADLIQVPLHNQLDLVNVDSHLLPVFRHNRVFEEPLEVALVKSKDGPDLEVEKVLIEHHNHVFSRLHQAVGHPGLLAEPQQHRLERGIVAHAGGDVREPVTVGLVCSLGVCEEREDEADAGPGHRGGLGRRQGRAHEIFCPQHEVDGAGNPISHVVFFLSHPPHHPVDDLVRLGLARLAPGNGRQLIVEFETCAWVNLHDKSYHDPQGDASAPAFCAFSASTILYFPTSCGLAFSRLSNARSQSDWLAAGVLAGTVGAGLPVGLGEEDPGSCSCLRVRGNMLPMRLGMMPGECLDETKS